MGRRSGSRAWIAFVGAVVSASLLASRGGKLAGKSNESLGSGVNASGVTGSKDLKARIAPSARIYGSPNSGLTVASKTFLLTPSGHLASAIRVTLPLGHSIPQNDSVAIATSEVPRGPVEYLPARIDAGRVTVSFTTHHFSFFTAILIDKSALFNVFKADFLDTLDAGATTDVSQPNCTGLAEAAGAGYSVSSSSTNTVFWCLGFTGTSADVNIVNNRRYPMEIEHPGFVVATPGKIDWSQLSSLSHFGSGNLTILAPGDEVGFDAAEAVGQQAVASTQMDGLGQSLYALQTGITTLIDILARFGLSSGSGPTTALSDLLNATACLQAVRQADPTAVIATCFSTSDLVKAFGDSAYLLAPVMALGSLVAFFHSEFNALVDVWTGRDEYTLTLAKKAVLPQAPWDSPAVAAPPGLASAANWQQTGGGSNPWADCSLYMPTEAGISLSSLGTSYGGSSGVIQYSIPFSSGYGEVVDPPNSELNYAQSFPPNSTTTTKYSDGSTEKVSSAFGGYQILVTIPGQPCVFEFDAGSSGTSQGLLDLVQSVRLISGTLWPAQSAAATPTTIPAPACIDQGTASQLFQTAEAVGVTSSDVVEEITCMDNWAVGTIVDTSTGNGVGSVAFQNTGGTWEYVTSAGFFSLFCSNLSQDGAPSWMLQGCPASQ